MASSATASSLRVRLRALTVILLQGRPLPSCFGEQWCAKVLILTIILGAWQQARSLSPGTTSSGSEEEVSSSRQRTGGFTAAVPLVIGNSSGRERLVAITEVEGSPATEYSAASGDDDDDEDGQTALSLAMQHATLDEGQRDETQAREFAEMQQIGGGMLKQVAIKSGYLYKKGEKRKVRRILAIAFGRQSADTAEPDLEEALLCPAAGPRLLL